VPVGSGAALPRQGRLVVTVGGCDLPVPAQSGCARQLKRCVRFCYAEHATSALAILPAERVASKGSGLSASSLSLFPHCASRFSSAIPDARMARTMRWTKRFLKRLALSEPQAPSPEERPAEHPAPAIQAGVAAALCTRCRRALVRNPHQVRAGRARARNAPRDERGQFVAGARTTLMMRD